MYVVYDTVTPDCHPLVVHVDVGNANVGVDNCMENQVMGQNAMKIKWGDLAQQSIEMYQLKQEVSKVALDHELVLCDNPKCTNHSHLCAIDRMYSNVASALPEASVELMCSNKSKNTIQVQTGSRAEYVL